MARFRRRRAGSSVVRRSAAGTRPVQKLPRAPMARATLPSRGREMGRRVDGDQEALDIIRSAFGVVTDSPAWQTCDVDLDADLRDLGIDSARLLELAGVLSEALGRELSDNELERIRTISDLVKWIRAQA